MKLHLPFRSLPAMAILVAFAQAAMAAAPSDAKKRPRDSGGEVEHLREQLHVAQKELARKEERIEALEKELNQLREARKRRGEAPAKEVATRKRPAKEAEKEMARREAQKKAPAAKAPPAKVPSAKAPPAKVPPAPAPGLFTVTYAHNSAASYEGREAALAAVRARLKRDPSTGFRIIGTANDSRYPEVNQVVADNRARFLADYFVLSGVPREAIVSVEGKVAPGEGEAGRRALVEAVPRAAGKTAKKGQGKG